MSNNKRVLPVAVLVVGVLVGAWLLALTTFRHHETEAAAVARVLTTTSTPTTNATTTTATTPSARKHAPKPRPGKVTPASVTRAVLAVDPRATPGVLVYDRQSRAPLLSVNAGRRFHSASLVKLLIAIDVLRSGAADDGTRKNLSAMLSRSDDNLASTYWVRQGGAPLVSREAEDIGLRDTAPPTPAGQWGNTWLSPRDLVTIYQYILDDLPAEDRDLIVHALAAAPRHAADGFDQWFGIPRGQHDQRAIKQGWSSSDTDICLHSTGLIGKNWRYVVVVLTEHPLGTSTGTGTASVTAAVRALAPLLN